MITDRYLGKTRSGQPGRSLRCSRKRKPRPWAIRRTVFSGFVSRLRIRDMISLRCSRLTVSVMRGANSGAAGRLGAKFRGGLPAPFVALGKCAWCFATLRESRKHDSVKPRKPGRNRSLDHLAHPRVPPGKHRTLPPKRLEGSPKRTASRRAKNTLIQEFLAEDVKAIDPNGDRI